MYAIYPYLLSHTREQRNIMEKRLKESFERVISHIPKVRREKEKQM